MFLTCFSNLFYPVLWCTACMQARCMHIKSSPQGLYGCLNLVKGCNKLAKRDSDNLLPWLSLACHFYLHGCVCAYVCMCVHVHIVHSYRYLNEPETDRPLKKKKTLMWWTTHPAAYTRCCSGSQVPCYYFSLIGTIRERVFSTTKNIQQRKRWWILPCHLHQVLFLRQNRAILADL